LLRNVKLKVKLKLLLETKVIAGVGLKPNHVWVKWLKFEIKAFRCRKQKLRLKKMFGSWVTPLVGRHVVKHGLKFEEYFCDCEKEKKK
jgi:hypothetical protein